jgi:hypothetical protein
MSDFQVESVAQSGMGQVVEIAAGGSHLRLDPLFESPVDGKRG